MLNLEAIIVLFAYFVLIGLLVNALTKANTSLEIKTDFMEAKSNSLKCGITADSIYSNAGGKTKINENCFIEHGKIKSKIGNQTTEERILSDKTFNSGNKIEIGVEEHYK